MDAWASTAARFSMPPANPPEGLAALGSKWISLLEHAGDNISVSFKLNPGFGTMSEDEPVCELHHDGEELFVLVDGVKIAKRDAPHTSRASTWILLEPGWTVRDIHNELEVRYEGATIH
jgi:hypothetical protein